MKKVCSGRSAHRSIRTAVASGLLASSVAFGGSANAAVMFTFDYSGNTAGVGFLDPIVGTDRQNALETAGTLFSNLFGNYFTDSATIDMAVTSTDDINVNTLASALSNVVSTPGTFGEGEVIRTKLQTGNDVNGAALDGVVDVNWGYGWELDPNTDPGNANFDLFAALFHEFTHALGFGSEIFGDPAADRFGEGGEGSGTQGTWSKWDQFLTSCSSGDSLVNGATFEVDVAATTDARANGGCFAGVNAVAGNGGALVQLFADIDQSHLDEATFSTSLMRPFRNEGFETRDYNAVELGILTDLGYTRLTTNPVPAPGPIALLLVSLVGMIGLRRRKA